MPQLGKFIFGLHDRGGEQLMLDAVKPGWVVITVEVGVDGNNFADLAGKGLGVIVRLNFGYEPKGTIPPSAGYDQFAASCAQFVQGSQGANIWIIGNETNLAGERPTIPGTNDREKITPDLYAQCFEKCWRRIKAVPGHKDDWVIPAPPGPWNDQTGDWVIYFRDILTRCVQRGAMPDALALHTYTHGYNASFITSEDKRGAPYQNYHSHFRVYRDFLGVVPPQLKSVPVLITETQPANDESDPNLDGPNSWWRDRPIGWVQAAYREINEWNSGAGNQKIHAVCLFRWNEEGTPERWSIKRRPAVQADFRATLGQNYPTPPVQTQPSTLPSQPPVTQPPMQPPVTQPPTQPDPLQQAAIAKALELKPKWMPINDKAALYVFALNNGLGYPQTDEFDFTFQGVVYRAQVFNKAIVFTKVGEWAQNQIKWVGKP